MLPPQTLVRPLPELAKLKVVPEVELSRSLATVIPFSRRTLALFPVTEVPVDAVPSPAPKALS